MSDAVVTPPVAPSVSVAVGVITYQRQGGLARLLAGLAAQQFPSESPPVSFTVVVVDNDAAGSARAVCDDARHRYNLSITYVVEPVQGIPQARNRVLSSLPDTSTFLAWIDDDEVPKPTWLAALVRTQQETDADVVMGSVAAVLPEGAPLWVQRGGFFNRRRFVDRASLAEGATNNCLMRIAAIRATGLHFEEKMRFNGGTDTIFFRDAARAGLRMVWSSDAEVDDYIPLSRCSLSWLLQRNFRAGNTLALADIRLDGLWGRLRRLSRAGGKFLQGVINLPMALVGFHELVGSLLMIARSLGMIVGVFGWQYREYSPRRMLGSSR